jgi:hypothetical protein
VMTLTDRGVKVVVALGLSGFLAIMGLVGYIETM